MRITVATWSIQQVECMWCLMHYGNVYECFDTKKEALNALDQAQHKTKIKDLCSEIEQGKDWLSLWDVSR